MYYLFQRESPSPGKITALGIYLIASLFFVVIGFIEFAFILHLIQRNEKQQDSNQSSESTCKTDDTDKAALELLMVNNIKYTTKDKNILVKPKYDVKKIDFIAFEVGTFLYVLFNVVYWVVFVNIKLDQTFMHSFFQDAFMFYELQNCEPPKIMIIDFM